MRSRLNQPEALAECESLCPIPEPSSRARQITSVRFSQNCAPLCTAVMNFSSHTSLEARKMPCISLEERSTNASLPFQPVVPPAQGIVSLRSCLCGLCSFLPATFPFHSPTERWEPSHPMGISDPWVFSFGLQSEESEAKSLEMLCCAVVLGPRCLRCSADPAESQNLTPMKLRRCKCYHWWT